MPGGSTARRPIENLEPGTVRIAPIGLERLVAIPDVAIGLVDFAHGSGSSSLDPRYRRAARVAAALAAPNSKKHLPVVPGATHLFGEPGALDEVIELARDCFAAHMPAQRARP